MFETMNDVPADIQEFYIEETVSEPVLDIDGNPVMIDETYTYIDENGDEAEGVRQVPLYEDVTYIVEKPRGETQRSVTAVMNQGKSVSIVEKFISFDNNATDWEYHDSYILWLSDEPEPYEQAENEEGQLEPSTPFSEALAAWESKKPEREPHKSAPEYSGYRTWRQIIGVAFEGVMCSATKEDFWGLSAAKEWIIAGNSTTWRFSNGNNIRLTPDNVDAFYNAWLPFRLSFFED